MARLLAWRAARGLPACSPDTGGYCKARQRLPEALCPGWSATPPTGSEATRPEAWLFHGRRVVIADGSTVEHARHPREPGRVPPARQPEAGLRLPDRPDRRPDLSLATGCVLDAAIGAGKGKLTGENALLRGAARPAEAGRHPAGRRLLQLVRRGGDAGWAMGVDVVMRQARQPPVPTSAAARGWAARTTWSSGTGSRNRPAWMSREEFAALPRALAMRELRVRVDKPGFRTRSFVVVTSLLDPGRSRAGSWRGSTAGTVACGIGHPIDQADDADGRAAVQDAGDGPQGDLGAPAGVQPDPRGDGRGGAASRAGARGS